MATKKEIIIKPIHWEYVPITFVGEKPLIVHNWSEKAKKEMLDAQQGKKKGKKKAFKNPVNDFIDSMYWLTPKPPTETESEEDAMKLFTKAVENGAKYGFPIVAFKEAGISAAYRSGLSKDKVSLRGAFFLENREDPQSEFVEIISDVPVMREDMVKIGMGTADLRYRAEFRNWSVDVMLKYDRNGVYDLESIINILNRGGAVCGVGEWRTEKSGIFGTYRVLTS